MILHNQMVVLGTRWSHVYKGIERDVPCITEFIYPGSFSMVKNFTE